MCFVSLAFQSWWLFKLTILIYDAMFEAFLLTGRLWTCLLQFGIAALVSSRIAIALPFPPWDKLSRLKIKLTSVQCHFLSYQNKCKPILCKFGTRLMLYYHFTRLIIILSHMSLCAAYIKYLCAPLSREDGTDQVVLR